MFWCGKKSESQNKRELKHREDQSVQKRAREKPGAISGCKGPFNAASSASLRARRIRVKGEVELAEGALDWQGEKRSS